MNFAEDPSHQGKYIIKHYVPGQYIKINQQNYSSSIIITPQQIIPWRPQTLADVRLDDLAPIFELPAELVLWGLGTASQMPAMPLRAEFINHQRVLEPMNTQSACGTFNMLLSDGREVTAALLLC
jgi:uncharacterized protein